MLTVGAVAAASLLVDRPAGSLRAARRVSGGGGVPQRHRSHRVGPEKRAHAALRRAGVEHAIEFLRILFRRTRARSTALRANDKRRAERTAACRTHGQG